MNKFGYRFRLPRLFHDPCRIVVAAVGQAPPQRSRISVVNHFAGLARRPRLVVGFDRDREVRHRRTGRQPQLLDREGIDERFDRRPDLAFALLDHIVFEITERRAAHIGFHITVRRVEGHQRSPQETLVVIQRIAGGHRGIPVALVTENPHFDRRVERLLNFLLGSSLFFQHPIAVGITHCAVDNRLFLFLAEVRENTPPPLQHPIHHRLYVTAHLRPYGLLGISLHRRIDRRIDLQPVAVQIVLSAVRLRIFPTPAVQRIFVPQFDGRLVIPIAGHSRRKTFAVGPIRGHHDL